MTRIFLAAFALSLLSLSSCKKTYTCECDYILVMGGSGGIVDGGTTTTKNTRTQPKHWQIVRLRRTLSTRRKIKPARVQRHQASIVF